MRGRLHYGGEERHKARHRGADNTSRDLHASPKATDAHEEKELPCAQRSSIDHSDCEYKAYDGAGEANEACTVNESNSDYIMRENCQYLITTLVLP